MIVAVVGSRTLKVENLKEYLPKNTTEIVSGGAKGIDSCAKKYALENNIKYTEFLPEYEKYGRSAPLRRNIDIVKNAGYVIAFWDGKSRGTAFTIGMCKSFDVRVKIYYHEDMYVLK